jgi:uncharacterized protein (DUF885 family)
MLGALQLWKLREMVVDSGEMGQKEYHDAILNLGVLPIEMVKAAIRGEELSRDFKPGWKFYDFD